MLSTGFLCAVVALFGFIALFVSTATYATLKGYATGQAIAAGFAIVALAALRALATRDISRWLLLLVAAMPFGLGLGAYAWVILSWR